MRFFTLYILSFLCCFIVNGQCEVSFNGKTNINFNDVCESPTQYLIIGNPVNLDEGDSFTFDSPGLIEIEDLLEINVRGNGKVIIPENVHVRVGKTLKINQSSGGCRTDKSCDFEFIINGTLEVLGDVENSAFSLMLSGNGSVIISGNLTNQEQGCIQCTESCPDVELIGGCNDLSECNSGFCQSISSEEDDNTPPVFNYCPDDIHVSLDDNCKASVEWNLPEDQIYDASGIASFTSNFNSGDYFEKGETEIIYTAEDIHGNKSQCKFKVIVIDDTAPVITGDKPQNQTFLVGEQISWDPPHFTDNCEIAEVTSTHNPGDHFHKGITKVTYTAKDHSENSYSYSFNIQVIEGGSPTFENCPGEVLEFYTSENNCNAMVSIEAPNAFGIHRDAIVSPKTINRSFEAGEHQVVFQARDRDNNKVSYCTVDILVLDTISPVALMIPKDTIVYSAGPVSVEWDPPVFRDNCTIKNITSNFSSGYIFQEGIHTIAFTVTDNSGNKSEFSFDLQVIFNNAPLFNEQEFEIPVNSETKICLTVSDPDGHDTFISSITNLTGYGISELEQGSLCFEFNPEGSDDINEILLEIEVCDEGIPQLCTTRNIRLILIDDIIADILPTKIITPGNDSYNDFWLIKNIESYNNNIVHIFDRQGRLIWECENYDNSNTVFKGRSNQGLNSGSLLPTGTYFYKIILIDQGTSLSGFIEVLR